jgi:hypothetical protein
MAGVLMLAEMQGVIGSAPPHRGGCATVGVALAKSDSEDLSLQAQSDEGTITVVAGRQIATRERLSTRARDATSSDATICEHNRLCAGTALWCCPGLWENGSALAAA